MAKFNTTVNNRTVNREGHAAYKLNDKEKLVTMVLTSFFNEKKFYGDNTKALLATLDAVIKTDPKFVSNLAVFARKVFNMRTVSHVLTAYLANSPNGKEFVRGTVRDVVVRGDDATEIMAFYIDQFGKPIPNSLKKGIADVLQGFDEYTLAKYKGDGKSVKMRDLICICHPKPKTKAQEALWKRCLEGELETPYTWETELSTKGNTKAVWYDLIDSKKVGYMGLLRNLRNILNANPANVNEVLDYLADPAAVRKSKQLPFRFLSAYRSVKNFGSSKVFDALESAIEASVDNMPKLKGTTVIAIDISGSMSSRISENSDIRCYDISTLLGVIANRICENAIVYMFDNDLYHKAFSTKHGILYTVDREAKARGGTNMNLPFEEMIRTKVMADRVIVISDNECNGGWYNDPVQKMADRYRKTTGNKNCWVHAIDIMGYGTAQFYGDKTNLIAGWSERVFDFIAFAEQGESNLVKTIEGYR